MYGSFRHQGAAVAFIALLVLLIMPVADTALGQELKVVASEDNGRKVSMDVQNADIGTVLRSLANYSGVNIVAAPAVEGKVTVKLDGVPWREALTVILRAHGFDFVEEHGILRVDSAEELMRQEVETKRAERTVDDLAELQMEIAHLSFANAEEVKESLRHMLTKRGKIDVDVRTNTLLISDIASRVAVIKQVAESLDSKTPQVEINAKLVDMDLRASREIGIVWSANNLKDAGGNLAGSASVGAGIQQPVGNLVVGTVQSYGDLLLNIQALEDKNLANLISNPIVTTTDNREASILVGQKIPLIVADEAGNAVVQLTTIGIVLRVTPHINSTDRITLDVHNEVSDLSSQATVQGGVIINTSEADTRVVVNNGETAIIGGLIRKVESHLENGVPVLKDVPVLGGLFKQTSKVDNNRELVIFVTPRIVTDEYLMRDTLNFDGQTIMNAREEGFMD